jgi:hypothetical protein
MSYLYGKNGLLQSLPGNVSSVTFGGVNDASAFWVNGNKTFASLYEYTPTKNTLLGTTIDVLRNQIVDISLGDISPTFDADTDIVFWAATNGNFSNHAFENKFSSLFYDNLLYEFRNRRSLHGIFEWSE